MKGNAAPETGNSGLIAREGPLWHEKTGNWEGGQGKIWLLRTSVVNRWEPGALYRVAPIRRLWGMS